MMRPPLIFPASPPRNHRLHSGRFLPMMNGYEKVDGVGDFGFGTLGTGGLLSG